MKKTYLIFLMGFFMLVPDALAASYRIVTEEAVLRKDRKFFAPVVARVSYGEVVEDSGRKGDWLRVRYKGKQGWVHISAVKEKAIRFTTGSGKAQDAGRDEVALAGKGFTPEIEQDFRRRNPGMRYDLVDQVESSRISENELQTFIQGGGLREPGGEP